MQLIILRHAVAFPRDPKRWPDDSQRPLTVEGVKRARRAASGLKRIIDPPARFLSSPLVRARDTATIFTHGARWPKAVECEALRPEAPAEDVLEALRDEFRKEECVAVVGHQPQLGRLLALCLPGETRSDAFQLKKSALACVRFEGPPQAHRGVLAALLPPRALRRI